MKKYFEGKRIWITGASSGIGYELVKQLALFDTELIISARNLAKLEALKASLNHKNTSIIPFDIGNEQEAEQVLKNNQDLLKEVDIVILNAGISMRSFVHETDMHVYQSMMDVNYFGNVRIALDLLKYFRNKKSGKYVVISSMAGKFGVPWRSGYSAAKMALHGFFDALRAENKDYQVQVCMICPGFIQTDISVNSLVGTGEKLMKMDDAQANGMPVEKAVRIMLQGISKNKKEFTVGGFKETRLANFVNRFFPSIFRVLIAKSAVR